MAIQAITPITSTIAAAGVGQSGSVAGGGDFGKMLTDMMGKLSETERGTNDLVTRAAAGENVDIADVMIATQAESLAFQVGIQVRNKLVEAYQEVFRMSV